MIEKHKPNDELDQLFLELLDGQWDADKNERLGELLSDDPAARARYREMMILHALLDDQFSGSPNLNCGVDASDDEDTQFRNAATGSMADSKRDRRSTTWRSRKPLALTWIAAATLIVSAGIWAFILLGGARDKEPSRAASDPGAASRPNRGGIRQESGFAVITRAIRPEWADGFEAIVPGQPLTRQWVKLQVGVVQIEFRSGARVTLEGPAQLRLDSESACFVQAGKLTVLAPPSAANFTVRSSSSEVIDLGTEFGLVVGESGDMDVHVLDGQVEVALKGGSEQSGTRKTLLAKQAAVIRSQKKLIREASFDQAMFEPIRAATLRRTQPLKIQFDCGNRSGLYQGSQAPAHAAGDMRLHEKYWNLLVADQVGGLVLADGSVSPHRIEVDLGHGKKAIDWAAEVDTMTGPQGKTRGVFKTALGRDAVSTPSIPGTGLLGLRFRGLPRGKYRIYVLARLSLDHPNWGNYLVEKAHVASVGLDLSGIEAPLLNMAPLDDPDAGRWVAGQTHVVTDVEIDGPDQYMTIITSKDRERSPTRAGGRAVILGVQILQLTDRSNSDGTKVELSTLAARTALSSENR
ncbi:MAG: FecR domain-containing protein [Phycisphaerae bacterium]|jgi:hypothetical protein|nr:FecR domain-containing protein [Phycisphaerae bacterium]